MRKCVGDQFALMEATVVMAMLLKCASGGFESTCANAWTLLACQHAHTCQANRRKGREHHAAAGMHTAGGSASVLPVALGMWVWHLAPPSTPQMGC
jgi:UDP-N-acetylmuramyl pentapeptide phosphotransferase/UDP-N-acetylglucosamine-1-phosphate transferase